MCLWNCVEMFGGDGFFCFFVNVVGVFVELLECGFDFEYVVGFGL